MQIENLENDFKYYNESQISKEEYLELIRVKMLQWGFYAHRF